jgi:hypothetical protein
MFRVHLVRGTVVPQFFLFTGWIYLLPFVLLIGLLRLHHSAVR